MNELRTESLCFSYGKNRILDNINLKFHSGILAGIIGPNGSGKSTLLSLLQGLLLPESGRVFLDDKSLHELTRIEVAKEIALVSQLSNIVFPFSSMEIVLMGRHPYQGVFGFENPDDVEIAEEALKQTDAFQFKDRLFSELSGGEKQRVLIARAVAQNSSVILLDEPTSALDLKHQRFIYELLRRKTISEKRNVVVVSHDINLAALYCDRLILMKEGRVFREGIPEEILNEKILREVYDTDIIIEHPKSGPPYVRILPGSDN